MLDTAHGFPPFPRQRITRGLFFLDRLQKHGAPARYVITPWRIAASAAILFLRVFEVGSHLSHAMRVRSTAIRRAHCGLDQLGVSRRGLSHQR